MRPSTLFVILILAAPCVFAEPRFRSDDPVWIDHDDLPFAKPNEVDASQLYDFVENSFVLTRRQKAIPRAANINTLGEVPDSSWFTNRIGRNPMSIEDLVKGPNTGTGPDSSQVWTIVSAKTEGISPGFTIRDSRGDVYFIKFDPLKNAQLATSAEVICTKFFHAFGYNVAENYLAYIRPESLTVGDEATIKTEDGQRRKMLPKDIHEILKKAPVMKDGTVQVIASRRVSGEPVGKFKYWGTRSDDANDVFPHQDRRELRGLRLFSAWLNHDDSRSINTLDLFEPDENGAGHMKHYLLDFGSTLGSGSVSVQGRRAGNEYIIEWGPIARAGASFGLWDRFWRSIPYPDYPAIGRYEAEFFQPQHWKPEYPNPAFDRMLNEDAFWATRIIAKFTDEMIRSVVATGNIADPEAEKYLADTIIKRRDKIARYYLSLMSPLDNFRLSNSSLEFDDLGVQAGIGQVQSYAYEWFRLDNDTGKTTPIGNAAVSTVPSISLPQDSSEFLMVRIHSNSSVTGWQKSVTVYLRNAPGHSVAGIERE